MLKAMITAGFAYAEKRRITGKTKNPVSSIMDKNVKAFRADFLNRYCGLTIFIVNRA